MSTSPSLAAEKKHWWLSNKKIVDRYLREARALIARRDASDVAAAVGLLDAALAVAPRLEAALELRARSLLALRRYRDVAEMLEEYMPSYRGGAGAGDDDSSGGSLGGGGGGSSGEQSSRAKLLSPERERSDLGGGGGGGSFRCFSVSDLKRRVLGIGPGLLQFGADGGRHGAAPDGPPPRLRRLPPRERLLVRRQLRLRRRILPAAAASGVGVGVPPAGAHQAPPPPPGRRLRRPRRRPPRRGRAPLREDPRRPPRVLGRRRRGSRRRPPLRLRRVVPRRPRRRLPRRGRPADAAADLNRALALDPASVPALRARAALLESLGALPDALRDLDHLKLLYDAMLRDRRVPTWRRAHRDVSYRDVPAGLRALCARIQELRRHLERAHLLLALKHKPEKAVAFVDRIHLADEHRDLDAVRDQARMSALILCRMLQKGYASIMAMVMNEEAAEKQRAKETAAAAAAAAAQQAVAIAAVAAASKVALQEEKSSGAAAVAATAPVYQGVFCRDMAVVGSLLSQVGFNRAIPVKYEALSC
uniref:J domain-containing protein n=1 Tax=Ananas comosus var. bracteatus TaxID=296719 RepID=A0A6V7PDC7_ANACO|nr:unnamed protein product [Ananas comosus var. bracteatus]